MPRRIHSLPLNALAYDVGLVTIILRIQPKVPAQGAVQPMPMGGRESAMSHEKGNIYDRADHNARTIQPG
jgi:hypothetical protein